MYGSWHYFAGAQSINLNAYNYITINTLVGYDQFVAYYGKENIVPILFQMDSGTRLQRALDREKTQVYPKYEEMCRRFLVDAEDFNEANIQKRGISSDFIIDNSGMIEKTVSEVEQVLGKTLNKKISKNNTIVS